MNLKILSHSSNNSHNPLLHHQTHQPQLPRLTQRLRHTQLPCQTQLPQLKAETIELLKGISLTPHFQLIHNQPNHSLIIHFTLTPKNFFKYVNTFLSKHLLSFRP